MNYKVIITEQANRQLDMYLGYTPEILKTSKLQEQSWRMLRTLREDFLLWLRSLRYVIMMSSGSMVIERLCLKNMTFYGI